MEAALWLPIGDLLLARKPNQWLIVREALSTNPLQVLVVKVGREYPRPSERWAISSGHSLHPERMMSMIERDRSGPSG